MPEEQKTGSPFIGLRLTLDEVNVILTALVERPFREVAELIGKVRNQAITQVNQKPDEGTTETTTDADLNYRS